MKERRIDMKEKNVKAKAPNKKVLGLTTKIFIALLAGAILGIVLCYLVPDKMSLLRAFCMSSDRDLSV